jgi:hypothetical protein
VASLRDVRNHVLNKMIAINGQKTDQILGIPDNAKDLTPWVAAAGVSASLFILSYHMC